MSQHQGELIWGAAVLTAAPSKPRASGAGRSSFCSLPLLPALENRGAKVQPSATLPHRPDVDLRVRGQTEACLGEMGTLSSHVDPLCQPGLAGKHEAKAPWPAPPPWLCLFLAVGSAKVRRESHSHQPSPWQPALHSSLPSVDVATAPAMDRWYLGGSSHENVDPFHYGKRFRCGGNRRRQVIEDEL
ncbi:sodium/potassium-transporting ATPase subunit gamma isoform X5 [Choloepus didactylus]|uniref:sodium/potassium-transporting ATPase subunit gamma isoform X5 n=1 Tax=Choloepus didactylus TaxID=27675 RepID=UPI00189DB176|nr:sodium/potassium-transporting ATPase subunit gamma isoform X5 [Choloepus didactylus]